MDAANMNDEAPKRRISSQPARRALARQGLLIACAVTVAALANAEPPESKPGMKTDRGTYLPVPAVKPAKAGGTFVDPTFGTEMLRVTDETDGPPGRTPSGAARARTCCSAIPA
jgi:hypothetical protein